MAQGKLKVKTKVPDKVNKNKNKKKGVASTSRSNKPIQSRKAKFEEAHKLKQRISKAVNKKAEQEIREMAFGTKKTLSKAQEAVVAHHQAQASTSTTQ